ncbi:MAG: acetyl-CoA carboxylase carboxyltransferase subunit beta [Clostridia bacterium]|nr:acetyl-CoA carboxylase carboxyltransferase subunit beta [Clostridia bacterium]
MIGKLFKKTTYVTLNKDNSVASRQPNVPEGMYVKCSNCQKPLYQKDLAANNHTCPVCGYHIRISARERIEDIVDQDTFEELYVDYQSTNPLSFEGYEEKVADQMAKTGEIEGVVTGVGLIHGCKAAIGVMNPMYMMGSMGSVIGEKLTLLTEHATKAGLPLIIFTASGGARMQEGVFSLMQMAKTSMALERHREAGELYISVLTDPTTGGVTASFAMLGDIILSEPNALIGFAGPRVIEQTIRQKLPEGFQRAEFLLEHGFIDKIVKRTELKKTLGMIIKLHGGVNDER